MLEQLMTVTKQDGIFTEFLCLTDNNNKYHCLLALPFNLPMMITATYAYDIEKVPVFKTLSSECTLC